MTLFWEQGYDATSLAQLRSSTGLSSASLYGAFGSKEGLFQEAVNHYMAGPGAVTAAADDESLTAPDALARLLHGSIDMQTDPSHPSGCLVALSAKVGLQSDRDAPAQARVLTQRRADLERIERCVARGVSEGDLPVDQDVNSTALIVHSFLLGLSTEIRDGAPPDQLHRAADALLAVLTSHPRKTRG